MLETELKGGGSHGLECGLQQQERHLKKLTPGKQGLGLKKHVANKLGYATG